MQLARLGRDDIKDAYNRLTELGYAPSTVRATHNLLRAALDDAVESGRIGANPAASRHLVPVAEKPKRTIPTLKDVNGLLSRLRASDRGRLVYGPALIALDTGLRRSEVLALKWSDLDLDTGLMEVQRAFEQTSQQGVIVKEPKTASGTRTVLLTKRSVEFLRAHQVEQDELREQFADLWLEEDWVFPCVTPMREHRPGRLWQPNMFTATFFRETKAAGLHIGMHDLRRLHSTTLEHAQVPQTEIAARLGHSNPQVTRRHYLFAVPDGQRQAVEAFEEAISEAVKDA
jgi:integrase